MGRAFTPKLSKAYTTLKSQRDDFELLFVSSDRDQDSFQEYFNEMTFGALPYEDRDAKAALSKRFEVSGIPKLIMLGPVIDKNTGERKVINDSVRSLNEKKCVIVFHEQGDDEEQAELVKVMKEVAATYDKGDGESDFSFYWALTTEGLSSRIRSVVNMTEVKEEP